LTCLAGGLTKDTQNLSLKFHKIHGHHRTPWMQDEVDTVWKLMQVVADSLAHAALDTVAFMRFAQYLSRCEPDARAGNRRGV
jgi:hypothetical protein